MQNRTIRSLLAGLKAELAAIPEFPSLTLNAKILKRAGYRNGLTRRCCLQKGHKPRADRILHFCFKGVGFCLAAESERPTNG
jgi:hypothetical protein